MMKIHEHLSQDTKDELNKMKRRRRNRKKKKENLSFNDIERLMGKFEPTYERRKGALRQK